MVRLRDWMVAGAVVPAALVVLPGLVVAVSMESGDVVQTLGVLLLSLVLLVPPGVALGALLGVVVIALARRLPERGLPSRRTAILRASGGAAMVAVGISAIPIRFTPSDGPSPLQVLAYSALFAAIPTTLAIISFNRWRPIPAADGTQEGEHLPEAIP